MSPNAARPTVSESRPLREEIRTAVVEAKKFKRLYARYLEMRPALFRHSDDSRLTISKDGRQLMTDEDALIVLKAGKLTGLTLPEAERRYALALEDAVRDERHQLAERITAILVRRYESENPGERIPVWHLKWLARAFEALNGFPILDPGGRDDKPLGKLRFFSNQEISGLSRLIEIEAERADSQFLRFENLDMPEEIAKMKRDPSLNESKRQEQLKALLDSGLSSEHEKHDVLSMMRRYFALKDTAREADKDKCCGQTRACPHCVLGRTFSQRSALRNALRKPEIKKRVSERLESRQAVSLTDDEKMLLNRVLQDKMANDDWYKLPHVTDLDLPKNARSGLEVRQLFDISSSLLRVLDQLDERAARVNLEDAPPHLLLHAAFPKKSKPGGLSDYED